VVRSPKDDYIKSMETARSAGEVHAEDRRRRERGERKSAKRILRSVLPMGDWRKCRPRELVLLNAPVNRYGWERKEIRSNFFPLG